jgi:hypothetical protein
VPLEQKLNSNTEPPNLNPNPANHVSPLVCSTDTLFRVAFASGPICFVRPSLPLQRNIPARPLTPRSSARCLGLRLGSTPPPPVLNSHFEMESWDHFDRPKPLPQPPPCRKRVLSRPLWSPRSHVPPQSPRFPKPIPKRARLSSHTIPPHNPFPGALRCNAFDSWALGSCVTTLIVTAVSYLEARFGGEVHLRLEATNADGIFAGRSTALLRAQPHAQRAQHR